MATIFPVALFTEDVIPLDLQWYQQDGTTIRDMTGWTCGCTVKVQPTDPDANALYQQDIVGGTNGQFNFAFTIASPGNYYLDVKIWDNTLNPPGDRGTVLWTQFQVNQSVTARLEPV